MRRRGSYIPKLNFVSKFLATWSKRRARASGSARPRAGEREQEGEHEAGAGGGGEHEDTGGPLLTWVNHVKWLTQFG